MEDEPVGVQPTCKSKTIAFLTKVVKQLAQQSFLIGVGLAVGIAAAAPQIGKEKGPLRTEYSVKYGVVPFVFFLMGISLKTKELGKAVSDWKLNVLIQTFSFVFIPGCFYGVYNILKQTDMNPALADGIVVLACMPCTTTTCNVLCQAADGNTAVSLFHSALANLLGAFLTPAILLVLLGNESSVSFVDVLTKIAQTLLLPLVVGQIIHNAFQTNKFVLWVRSKSGDVTKILLLVIIWNTFCDTFARDVDDVESSDYATIIILVVVLYAAFFSLAVGLYSRGFLHLNRRTQVSAWFCSTQKTIVMGIPLIKIIFEGNPEIGLISIPLLIYHPTQTLLASLLLNRMSLWVKKDDADNPKLIDANESTGLLNRVDSIHGPGNGKPLSDGLEVDSSQQRTTTSETEQSDSSQNYQLHIEDDGRK